MKLSKKFGGKKAPASSSLTMDNMEQGMEDIYYDRNTDEQTTASGGVLDYIAGSSAAAAPSNNDSVHDPLAYYDLYSSNTDFSSTPDGKEAIQPVETPVPATSSLSLPTFSMPTIPSMPSFKIERRKSKSEKAKEVEVKEKTDSGSSTPRKCKADDIPIMDSPLRMQLLRSSITNKTDSPNIQERKVIKKEAYPAPVTVHDYFDDGGHSGYDSPASAINQDPPVNSKENNMSVISAILSSQIDNSNTSTPLDRTVEGTPVKDRSRQGSPSLPRKDSPSADGNSEDEEAHSMLSAEYARALRTLTNVLGKGLTVIKYDSKGRPKAEIINCDPECTVLIWLPAHDPSEVDEEDIKEVKYINVSEITGIRLGTEIDPATPNEALLHAAKEKLIPQTTLMSVLEMKERERKDIPKKSSKAGKTVRRASSLLESLFVVKDKDLEILYGTEVLRDNCTPEQLKISFALFTENRILNIQCLEEREFDLLVKNLRIVISPPPSLDNHIASKLGKNPMKGLTRGRKSWKERSNSVPTRQSGKVRSKSIGDITESSSNSRTDLMKKYHGNIDGTSNNSIKSSLSRSVSKDDQDVSVVGDESETLLVPTKAFLDFMAKIDIPTITASVYEQNRYYGTNMYSTLKPGDEMIIENYMLRGYTMEVALNRLFAKRILRTINQPTAAPQQQSPSIAGDAIAVAAVLSANSEQKPRSPMIASPPQAGYGNITHNYGPSQNMGSAHPNHMVMPSPYAMMPPPHMPPGYPQHPGAFVQYPPMQPALYSQPSFHFNNATPSFDPSLLAAPVNSTQKDVKSKDIIKLGVTLFQQEQAYGVNMFDSMTSEDEAEFKFLQEGGMSAHQAALFIFERKVASGVITPQRKPDESIPALDNNMQLTSISAFPSEEATANNGNGKMENAADAFNTEPFLPDEAKLNDINNADETAGKLIDHGSVPNYSLQSSVIDPTNLIPILAPFKASSDDDFDKTLTGLKSSSKDSDSSVEIERFIQQQTSTLSGGHPSIYGAASTANYQNGYAGSHTYSLNTFHSYPTQPVNPHSSIYNPSHNSPYHPTTTTSHMYPYHAQQSFPMPPPNAGLAIPQQQTLYRAPSIYNNIPPTSTATATFVTNNSHPSLSRQSSVNEMLPAAMEASRPAITRTASGLSWLFSGSTSRSLSSIDPRLNETDVRKIEEMGFSRDQAVSALMVNNYNMVMAINTLMDHR